MLLWAKHSNASKRFMWKAHHYFDVYERHMARFRQQEGPIVMLEMGVFQGGSLDMWRNYFGPRLELHGMDINPEIIKCDQPPAVQMHIGSQGDDAFLERFVHQLGDKQIDIVLDDAAHQSEMMIKAFQWIYPKLSPNGVYMLEDVATNYNPDLGFYIKEGLRRPGTFIEHSKMLIDELNAFSFKNKSEATAFTRSTDSIHFYDSMVIFERKPRTGASAPVIRGKLDGAQAERSRKKFAPGR